LRARVTLAPSSPMARRICATTALMSPCRSDLVDAFSVCRARYTCLNLTACRRGDGCVFVWGPFVPSISCHDGLGVWTFFHSFTVMTLLSWYSLFVLLINILPHKQNWWYNMIINTMKYSIKLSYVSRGGVFLLEDL
jgi:hypothetical protein